MRRNARGCFAAVKGMSLPLFYPCGQGESPLSLSAEERRTALEQVISLRRAYLS